MVNITISIPEDLSKRMKRHSEIKWSEVARKAVVNYIDQLEKTEERVISAEALSLKLKKKGNRCLNHRFGQSNQIFRGRTEA